MRFTKASFFTLFVVLVFGSSISASAQQQSAAPSAVSKSKPGATRQVTAPKHPKKEAPKKKVFPAVVASDADSLTVQFLRSKSEEDEWNPVVLTWKYLGSQKSPSAASWSLLLEDGTNVGMTLPAMLGTGQAHIQLPRRLMTGNLVLAFHEGAQAFSPLHFKMSDCDVDTTKANPK